MLEVAPITRQDRAGFAREGLVPARGCPAAGALRVTPDGGGRADGASGAAYEATFAPGCATRHDHTPETGHPDPLFSPRSAGITTLDPARADPAVAAILDPDTVKAIAAEATLLI